jgi:hypothetical protein
MKRLAIVRNAMKKKKAYTTIDIELFRRLEAKVNKEGFGYFATNSGDAATTPAKDQEGKGQEDADMEVAQAFQHVTTLAKERAKGRP